MTVRQSTAKRSVERDRALLITALDGRWENYRVQVEIAVANFLKKRSMICALRRGVY